MKLAKKILAATLIAGSVTALAFAGCTGAKGISSIEKTSTVGLKDIYTITYTDGSTSQFTVTNGSNADANNITINDIYEEYKNQYGDISFSDFLDKYLNAETDSAAIVQDCLKSCVSVYCEFTTTTTKYDFFGRPIGTETTPSLQIGSGIIYKMDSDYSYIITNYHVVYGENTNEDISEITHVYLYGSQSAPYAESTSATSYSYDEYAIACDYVGGSIDHDVAVLRAKTDDIRAINDNVRAVDVAEGYTVGQTAIAIGNPGGEGISATKGIVSVDNEYITLDIDGTSRSYRSIRIDTAIYEGSSGGGLFDMYGRLIGLTNAGDGEEQNVNFAIPVQIVTGVADNIIENNSQTVRKITIGVTVVSSNSRNEFDSVTGLSTIKEDVTVDSVVSGSIAETLGVNKGDMIKGIVINGQSKLINRSFELGDLILTIRTGDEIKLILSRDGEEVQTEAYTVQLSDMA